MHPHIYPWAMSAVRVYTCTNVHTIQIYTHSFTHLYTYISMLDRYCVCVRVSIYICNYAH